MPWLPVPLIEGMMIFAPCRFVLFKVMGLLDVPFWFSGSDVCDDTIAVCICISPVCDGASVTCGHHINTFGWYQKASSQTFRCLSRFRSATRSRSLL